MADMDLGWDDMPDEPYYARDTLQKLRLFMYQRNPRRWRKLQREFKWLQDEMKKLQLDPDDARFLL